MRGAPPNNSLERTPDVGELHRHIPRHGVLKNEIKRPAPLSSQPLGGNLVARSMRSVLDFLDLIIYWPLAPIRIAARLIGSKRKMAAIDAARRVAQRKGIKIQEVEREINRSYIGEPGLPKALVAAYSIPQRYPGNHDWSFLHRKYSSTAEYPGCHSPVFRSGEITPELDKLFMELSTDELWQSIFIEIECSDRRVCIYWDESTGEKAAEKVIETLELISRLPS